MTHKPTDKSFGNTYLSGNTGLTQNGTAFDAVKIHYQIKKTKPPKFPSRVLKKINWSGKRDSNPRPMPWQGIALSTELFPHIMRLERRNYCCL